MSANVDDMKDRCSIPDMGGGCHFVTVHIPAIGLPNCRTKGKKIDKKGGIYGEKETGETGK
jgi:hypothetical protein